MTSAFIVISRRDRRWRKLPLKLDVPAGLAEHHDELLEWAITNANADPLLEDVGDANGFRLLAAVPLYLPVGEVIPLTTLQRMTGRALTSGGTVCLPSDKLPKLWSHLHNRVWLKSSAHYRALRTYSVLNVGFSLHEYHCRLLADQESWIALLRLAMRHRKNIMLTV